MPDVILHLPERHYDAFIFDCDGTLVDSMPLHFSAWQEALSLNGASFEFSWELFQSRAGMGLDQTVEELNQQFSTSLDPVVIGRIKRAAYERQLSAVKPIAELERFARAMAVRGPMSVASGGTRVHVERSLVVTGLAPLFPIVITQEDVVRGKPDPEMFLLAAERMGVTPQRCLVLEDSPLGLEAARAAGMGGAWVEHRSGIA